MRITDALRVLADVSQRVQLTGACVCVCVCVCVFVCVGARARALCITHHTHHPRISITHHVHHPPHITTPRPRDACAGGHVHMLCTGSLYLVGDALSLLPQAQQQAMRI